MPCIRPCFFPKVSFYEFLFRSLLIILTFSIGAIIPHLGPFISLIGRVHITSLNDGPLNSALSPPHSDLSLHFATAPLFVSGSFASVGLALLFPVIIDTVVKFPTKDFGKLHWKLIKVRLGPLVFSRPISSPFAHWKALSLFYY